MSNNNSAEPREVRVSPYPIDHDNSYFSSLAFLPTARVIPVSTNGVLPTALTYCSVPTFRHVKLYTWKDSLLSCFNQIYPSCFMSVCCTICIAGQISERIGAMNCLAIVALYAIFLIIILVVTIGVGGNTLGWLMQWVLGTIVVATVRKRFRHMFSIENTRNDYVEACCCGPCAVAQVNCVMIRLYNSQMARHVYLYKDNVLVDIEGGCRAVCSTTGRPFRDINVVDDAVSVALRADRPQFLPVATVARNVTVTHTEAYIVQPV